MCVYIRLKKMNGVKSSVCTRRTQSVWFVLADLVGFFVFEDLWLAGGGRGPSAPDLLKFLWPARTINSPTRLVHFSSPLKLERQ